jgi:hypothetical protein
MTALPNIGDIERWYPQRWSEIAGNYAMKRILQAFSRDHQLFNMLFTGESRSGKNRTVALAIKSFFCLDRPENLDPCNHCRSCNSLHNAQQSHWGLYGDPEGRDFNYLYLPATQITQPDLAEIEKASYNEARPLLIHIDEAADLSKSVQANLLTMMDVRKSVFCIGTSIRVKAAARPVASGRRNRVRDKQQRKDPLLVPFRLRFSVHNHTERPTPPDFVQWVKDRCVEWKIDPDSDATVLALGKRCSFRPGIAQKLLGASTLFGRKLKPPMIDDFDFDADQ